MLEIRNHTPLTTRLIPGLDKNGYDYAVVIMKGKFTIVPGQTTLVFSEEPALIFEGDVHYGEPDNTSVRYESDMVTYKRATDIIVNGHAYAPQQRSVYTLEASVQVGDMRKTCQVIGDRVWAKSAKAIMTWEPSAPQPFERMPIVYERAFGGIDRTDPNNKTPEFSPHNPVGRGFIGTKSTPKEGVPLPNIEDPRHLIQRWDDRPPPAGFGFIGRAWQPRVALTGTYDDAWKKKRLPLLPLDFSDRFFNGAHPDLVCKSILTGGERVSLTHLSTAGPLTFDLPTWKETVAVFIKGKKETFPPALDTVLIEPDTNSVIITWRVTVPCFKQFLYLDTVIIGKKRAV
ncbi:MAG: DUF2169 domain-containing protein [Gammaproteobacteria bacterium]|nr:DUF2169 domain-containing protein [Gammaproteobacteria bacterium]